MSRMSVSPGRMVFLARTLLPIALLVVVIGSAQERAKGDDVVEYLGRVMAWYRDVSSVAQLPGTSREALYKDHLRKTAGQTLRSALRFGRAQAALPATGGDAVPATDEERQRRLQQAGTTAEQRIAQLQAEIENIGEAIRTAPARSRAELAARREERIGELNFATARKENVQGLLGIGAGKDGGVLTARLNDLERSVDLDAAPAGREQTEEFHPESAGVIGLTSQVFAISRKISRLDEVTRETERLRQRTDEVRQPLRDSVRAILRRIDAIAQSPGADAASLTGTRKELDGLLVRFKQISAASAPLAEQTAGLDSARSVLVQWRGVLSDENSSTLRYLLFRICVLAAGVLIILLLSALWRRATMRYVQDVRRRRQLLVLRRIVVGCTIAAFVTLSFVTEFGSLATFAGFSAAGIAVAMQSVILSVVAYFFLVGRWGVRVGDRITVSGVTGDVIDISLFRVYLMELAKSGQDASPTGRVVVFPNAVFFQPSALFKQFPGIEYAWRTVSFTVPPYSDYSKLEQDVLGAIESVFSEYAVAIEKQHHAAQVADNLHTPKPRPEAKVRFVEGYLEFSVRYPVEMRRAGEIDDRVTRELLSVLERHPTVTFVHPPKLEAAIR